MKTALILTGFCRDYKTTYPALKKHLLDKHDIDVYISSWDVIQYRPQSWDINDPKSADNSPLYPIDVEEVINLYNYNSKLINYEFPSFEEHCKNRFPDLILNDRYDDVLKTSKRASNLGKFWVERIRSQWWKIKQGWELVKNPEQYDIIVRTRFDFLLQSDINFKLDSFVTPRTDLEFLDIYYCDYLAYGSPYIMNKYCTLFDNIKDIYDTYNIDITYGENMLKFYMEEYKNSIKTIVDENIKYHLIRQVEFERKKPKYMKTFKEKDFTRGWFIGDFIPTVHSTKDFEVAVKRFQAGDSEPNHYHKIATEITLVVSGKVLINGEVYYEGDIIIAEPNQTVEFVAVEDAVLTVVKVPCVKNDKYEVEDNQI